MNTQVATRPGQLQKLQTQLDYILLDGSSSMMDQWWDCQDAIQAYIDGLKRENTLSQCMVHVFNSTYRDLIARDVSINDWTSLRDDPIGSHWGTTPLYDAVVLMGARLRDLDPPRASLVIVTDGEEMGSKFATLTQAKAILDWCRAKGWQVTFIGANFANEAQAGLLGGNRNSAIGVERKQLSNAASALAKKRARYGLTGAPMHWSEDEQQQFGGYLAGPSK